MDGTNKQKSLTQSAISSRRTCEAGHESRGRCNERFFSFVSGVPGAACAACCVTVCGTCPLGTSETVQSTHIDRSMPSARLCAASIWTANRQTGGMFGGHPPYVMRSSCANVAFQAAGPLLLAPAGACLCLLMTLDRPSAGRIWLLVIFQQKGWTQEYCVEEQGFLHSSRPFCRFQGSLRGGWAGVHRAPEIVAA